MMTETLEMDGLAFTIRRSDRRRTLGLTVDRAGELVIHAPFATGDDELADWAGSKLLWVHRKLALKDESALKALAPEYVTGETFSYLGRRYRLVLVDEQTAALDFDGTRFLLRRDARPADAHFRQWYIDAGKEWLARRIDLLRSRTGPAPTRVLVRDLGYRWGSCGRDGALYINWRVLQLPVRLVDYVLVHELCHLVEPSHNRQFWRSLERALPDWQDRNAELHRGTADVFWCAPAMRQ
ncbi:SprT family zinc-dependent metalloprotease [uncultured Thiodictyon sp.]|uniref:M48 family metallopeptidase n=1 Tax=uncultured Thiodictyon sp. TaxID=1846217 RepID=UPI0025E43946|nr:SprT family zinc-dependent metalloprotease [uncultured Thiodictyon sp.]